MMKLWLALVFTGCLLVNCSQKKKTELWIMQKNNPVYSRTDSGKLALRDEEWKNRLSPEVYHIAREKGTERPFTSKFETLKNRYLLLRGLRQCFV
jgi:peptide-methionine (R)-S-oxide reductase